MDNKYLGLLGVLVLVGLGVTAYTFTQGSIFTDDTCGFNLVENPGTGATYSSVDDYREAFADYTGANETVVDSHFESAEFEIRDGQVFEKNSECSSERLRVE